MAHEPTVLQLYRALLRTVKVYPSLKRNVMYEEIRDEFRRNKTMTDRKKVQDRKEYALKCLENMEQYTRLNKRSRAWTINLA
mmetsp:Transcript_6120/g.9430  ORF Transcript_6120/g.9430 Transcript_6120/m.9430 type:complete len:82 (+) Transcript_6120:63-308(+)|eukprot:CAMPEP_0184665358 /NCGR_PEP_ID=MMETSP0308-20130426/56847_1 /TAXON_ID=38269 /ORGANISM="Gloeochaete witrockiana, Strain SAG 46.84" /LENGTH=81 /DNA_ID=CAMNT_0027109307 /DNA_START=42 /DNA_END=287 /DNA_ORIENTATION=-